MLLAAALLLAAAAAVALLLGGGRPRIRVSTGSGARTGRVSTVSASRFRKATAPVGFVEQTRGRLSAPVQDAAVVALGGGRVMALGGLTAADTSRRDILVVGSGGERRVGSLPLGLHDTAAVRLGSFVYLFGGGTAANTQSDQILRVSATGGTVETIGRLPAPSSDQSAAALGRTAYVVGGYTGTRWLDTIVAWRPGGAARVVGRLPSPLRYAAVAAVGKQLVIAGGSLPDGTASDSILVFSPTTGRVRKLARLPSATTHAAAAALRGVAYVIGGRGAALGSVTGRIVAFDPVRGRIRVVGRLGVARSDLGAVASGKGVFLLGGRSSQGTEPSLSELVPSAAKPASKPVTAVEPKGTPGNVYAYDGANMLTGAARSARSLVYVPNSGSDTVDVIDPRTYKIVERFAVGGLPQHIVPSHDLKTLYVTNDAGNSLTAIDPRTGKPGRIIRVDDPYNLYFTPDGRYAIVVAERQHRLDFRDAHTLALRRSLTVACAGVDHMDVSADGRYLIASCEFSGQLIKVDVASERVVDVLTLPDGSRGAPQDVRISPDGSVFYVADLYANGVWKVDGRRLKVTGFVPTGKGAHGLYPSRDGKHLFVSNRGEGSVSVISFKTQNVVAKWRLPGGGSPDMGGVSADGKMLWLTGRYNSEVYAISTRNGRLLARIPVGAGPHGLCLWPQPGRYSLGHTGNMR